MISRSPLKPRSTPVRRKRSKPRRGIANLPKYKRWAHEHEPCIIFRQQLNVGMDESEITCEGPIAFHHCRAMGGPRTDTHAVMLCEFHHSVQKSKVSVHAGKRKFEERYGVDLDQEAKNMFQRFLDATGRTPQEVSR